MIFPLAGFVLMTGFTACSDNTGSSTTTETDSNTIRTGDSANTLNGGTDTGAASANTTTMANTSYSNTRLNKADSLFVVKAATGGMEEVQGGQAAQQNAQNERVRSFGQMMVNDHTQANNELMGLASAKGLTIPGDLPAARQKMVDQMKNMKGSSFDKHYIGMMVTDHKKNVADFERASNTASDPDLKAWATKTLPVLRMHLDSAQAINASIK